MPSETPTQPNIVALLCVGETVGGANIALTPLHGNPFIHHLIKRLQIAGIEQFFIALDTVPGSLLSYSDAAKRDGIDVRFVRASNDIAPQIPAGTRVIVQLANTLWDSAFLQKAIGENRTLVAAVEERAENHDFERIDLNHRWAGLAILERDTLLDLGNIPDGWDIGSALMRRALQKATPLWQVRQAELQAGAVRQINSEAEASLALRSVGQGNASFFEKWTIQPLVAQLLPLTWRNSALRTAVDWLFPASAAMSTCLAWFEFSVTANLFAIFAVLSASWRSAARQAEYRQAERDPAGFLAWLVLAAALPLVLYNSYEVPGEAGFLSLVAFGMGAISRNAKFWLFSPFGLAVIVLWGQVAGLAGWALRLAIIAQPALLVVPLRKDDNKNNQT